MDSTSSVRKLIFSIPMVLILFVFVPGQENTIATTIPVPDSYIRMNYPGGSFSSWVQTLPVKKDKTILLYDNSKVQLSYYNVFAVVQMPLLFNSDLEQCADYCMRFWAEYHKTNAKLENLYLFDYNGKKKGFTSSKKPFEKFLKWAFAYSNSYSLKKGCRKITEGDLKPGDMIVQNETGGIGHVSMIMDICKSETGKRLFLIGFSFMPAQEFHIEKASDAYGVNGWFTLEGYYRYLAEYFNFGQPVLRRFVPL